MQQKFGNKSTAKNLFRYLAASCLFVKKSLLDHTVILFHNNGDTFANLRVV